jgi:hypothetical protein
VVSDQLPVGPPFITPTALAVETSGHLVVTDRDLATVLRVDPVGGDTPSSGSAVGGGPPFSAPVGITVEATGLLVVDSGLAAVVQVDR